MHAFSLFNLLNLCNLSNDVLFNFLQYQSTDGACDSVTTAYYY